MTETTPYPAQTTAPDAAPVEAQPTTVPEDAETFTTARGTTIAVVDGNTVATENDGSVRVVTGDHFDTVVAVAQLLNL
jgi:hypothetical protein